MDSVASVRSALAEVGYLADESAALVAYLAQHLGKPVLVEGPAGVGKTELAKALSRATGRELIRLQCYEGLDEAKALYEWNYRRQLLRIQASADETSDAFDEIFSEDFLLTRPLLQAIASPDPVVLLIDEIDKTDQEFEAMLLEVLSRLPDLDPRARPDRGAHPPDRRLDLEQLARADRGAEAPLPVSLARLPRRRARDGDRPPARPGAGREARPGAWSRWCRWFARST